jgi:death-on-curing protein
LDEVLALHDESISRYGGAPGVHDLHLIESAVALPGQGFFGTEAYPSIEEKASVLGFALVSNHGFRDGNKRVGYAAMDTFLRLNGIKLQAGVVEAERIVLGVAAGTTTREELTAWVRKRIVPVSAGPESPS